jgi:hypothetical protein
VDDCKPLACGGCLDDFHPTRLTKCKFCEDMLCDECFEDAADVMCTGCAKHARCSHQEIGVETCEGCEADLCAACVMTCECCELELCAQCTGTVAAAEPKTCGGCAARVCAHTGGVISHRRPGLAAPCARCSMELCNTCNNKTMLAECQLEGCSNTMCSHDDTARAPWVVGPGRHSRNVILHVADPRLLS